MSNFSHHKAYINKRDQKALLQDILNVIEAAPLYIPVMPKTGHPFSVRETNCGPLGWVSDKAGYRYQANHPVTNAPWPQMPASLLALWTELTNLEMPPEAGLINHYSDTAKMGLHRDKDEQDLTAPVLSISLGNSAAFRIGGLKRKDKTRSIELQSGDVVILAGKDRLAYHGIDKIIKGSSDLLSGTPLEAGRLNITLRRVTISSKDQGK